MMTALIRLFPELPLASQAWLGVSSAASCPVSIWDVVSPVSLHITAWLPLWASGHKLAGSPAQTLPRSKGAVELPALQPHYPVLALVPCIAFASPTPQLYKTRCSLPSRD